jgi:putative N6-adenine-specific DNA methylase
MTKVYETVKHKNEFFASCPKGIEDYLEQELIQLNIKNPSKTVGGVYFSGPSDDFIKVIFHSRLASRVYKLLYSFDVRGEKDFYTKAFDLKWKAVFDINQTFKINTILYKSPDGKNRSKFSNTMFLSQVLKDAIVDRFREDFDGMRPNVNKQNADASFLVHVRPFDQISPFEKVTIMLDLVGEALSNRGYRDAYFEAPLRENLAAALVIASEWDQKETFIDLMCGSGTLLIEALMIKGKIPPSYFHMKKGLFFPFLNLEFYTKDEFAQKTFEKERQLVVELGQKGIKELQTGTKLYGFDLNHFHLDLCKKTLEELGLGNCCELKKEDATKVKNSFGDSGLIICNPPYGERMGTEEDLTSLYYEMGENLKKNFKGFKAFIFTGNLPLLKKIELRTSSKKIFFNGDIECRLARYNLY